MGDWTHTAQWVDDSSSSSSASEWLHVDRHTTVDRQDSDSEEFEFVLLSEPHPLAQSAIPNPSTVQSPPEQSQTVNLCIARDADSAAQLSEAADQNPAEQRQLSRQISEQCSSGPESIAQLMMVSETSVFARGERAQMAEVLEEARHDARRAKQSKEGLEAKLMDEMLEADAQVQENGQLKGASADPDPEQEVLSKSGRGVVGVCEKTLIQGVLWNEEECEIILIPMD